MSVFTIVTVLCNLGRLIVVKKVCGGCPDGHNVSTGSQIWVKCSRQSGMRSVNAVCNLDQECLPRTITKEKK